MRKMHLSIIALICATIILVIGLLNPIVSHTYGLHTLFPNSQYSTIRNESINNGTPEKLSGIQIYYQYNVSGPSGSKIELAVIPASYWNPTNLTINRSVANTIPGYEFNLVWLDSSNRPYPNLEFKLKNVSISSSNCTIGGVGQSLLIRQTQSAGYNGHYIGTNYLIAASVPIYPQLNVSTLKDGVYFLRATISFYNGNDLLPQLIDTVTISIPYCTIIG